MNWSLINQIRDAINSISVFNVCSLFADGQL